MSKKLIPQRKRIYIAVEGESERAFIIFLQKIADDCGIHIHLDCVILNGGGYRKMLERAISERKRKERQKAKTCILLIDTDRALNNDDGWSLDQLSKEAEKNKMRVCYQDPNLEGVLIRLHPGNEKLKLSHSVSRDKLKRIWPEYSKPMNAQALSSKFTLDDLRRTAKKDRDLHFLLKMIGLA